MPSLPPSELTATIRTPTITYELLDIHDELIGVIDGVTGGSLEWNANTSIHVSGSMTVDDRDGIDWINARVRIIRTINGYTWSRGIFIPSAPQDSWKGGVKSWNVELLGKLTLLDQDKRGTWTGIPAGVNGVATVRSMLAAAGHQKVAIQDSDLALTSALVFEPNTSLLTVCNKVLNAIGYWALDADEQGYFVSSPYKLPAERPVKYELLDDENGIVQGDFERDQDIYNIPNRVTVIGESNGENPPLIGTAENDDPSSRFSITARGGLVVPWSPEGYSGAATQEVIDAEARRILVERSSVTATAPIKHAPVPLRPNEVIRWRNQVAGIDGRWAVQGISEPLNSHDDMTTTLREVVDL